jgi:hypothetical protein
MKAMREQTAENHSPVARHDAAPPQMQGIEPGISREHWQTWQHAFLAEWYRLAEGCADLEQTADLAIEVYTQQRARDPAQVARELWG